MKKSAIIFLAVVFSLAAGCGKTENTDKSKDQNTRDQKLQTSASDKSIEIHASGMTCTGCENTIKSKVKEVEGVKEVMADFKSNLVKATYDPAKTNPEKIKEAIVAAGYKIEHTH